MHPCKRRKEDEDRDSEETETRTGNVREECQLSIPVLVKVERINRRLKAEQDEAVWTSKGRRKEGPTGKEKMKQPTLSLFMSLWSGLKGSGGKRARQVSPSEEPNQEVTGKGPPTGPNTGDLQIFGEGERKISLLSSIPLPSSIPTPTRIQTSLLLIPLSMAFSPQRSSSLPQR